MSDFATDLSRSARLFKDVVWPSLQPVFKGELVPVESVTDSEMSKILDLRSGIDAWHLSHNKQVRGIASRVQGRPSYGTFTTRYRRFSGSSTEYEKRLKDMRSGNGWLYPHLTIHAYVDDTGYEPRLLSVAAAKTEDIMSLCERIVNKDVPTDDEWPRPKPYGFFQKTGNAEFLCVRWSWLKHEGLPIHMHVPENRREAA